MQPKVSFVLGLLTTFVVSFSPPNLARADDSAVQAEYLETWNGKPPSKYHFVRLTLVNQHDKPVWFILPYWGDKPLPKNAVFPNKGWDGKPFAGKQFDGNGGVSVEVRMYGGDGFKAFHLSPKGRLELNGYAIESIEQPLGDIVVLEAQQMKVNGKTPLEKWVPYGTTSGKDVKVDRKAINEWKNLDWDAKKLKDRDDYPKEKVTEVKSEGVRSWTLKFGKKAK